MYEVDVVNNTVFELSSSSREDKERSGFAHPILIFLVFYKLRVRNIVIPNLQKQEFKKHEKSQELITLNQHNKNQENLISFFARTKINYNERKDLTEKIETSLSPYPCSEAKEEEPCSVVAKEPNI